MSEDSNQNPFQQKLGELSQLSVGKQERDAGNQAYSYEALLADNDLLEKADVARRSSPDFRPVLRGANYTPPFMVKLKLSTTDLMKKWVEDIDPGDSYKAIGNKGIYEYLSIRANKIGERLTLSQVGKKLRKAVHVLLAPLLPKGEISEGTKKDIQSAVVTTETDLLRMGGEVMSDLVVNGQFTALAEKAKKENISMAELIERDVKFAEQISAEREQGDSEKKR